MSQCPCCFGDNPYEGEAGCQFRALTEENAKLKAKLKAVWDLIDDSGPYGGEPCAEDIREALAILDGAD